jgi:signal transduction histidine kinase
LTVAILGVFTAGLSAAALYRAIAASNALRLERAREAVGDEVARLVAVGADAMADPPTLVGLRGGLTGGALTGGALTSAGSAGASPILSGVPVAWRPGVEELLARAGREGGAATLDTAIAGARLVARIGPAPGGRAAWAAIAVKPSPYLQSWRLLVGALTLSALLLVGNAAYALVTVERAAHALEGALRALARDLSAPVPRSPVRELGAIADGIATLARHLAEARQIQERMGRDLSRQERLAALGRVVAGVAHEVRNPLASIKLRLDLAMTEPADRPLDPTVRQAIAHASAEITRLDRLVADLLIVSGRPLGPRQAIAVGDLVRARADGLSPWAGLRGVTIDAAGQGAAAADPDGLARAVDNLLRNAVEASPAGARIEVRVDAGDGALRIAVEDSGPGVPLGRAGELFEPFFTTKGDGTGLGLAISRAIARAHGGDVVYARRGEVTRFLLTLPALEVNTAQAGSAAPS